MHALLQVVMVILLGPAVAAVAEEPRKVEWQPLKVTRSIFTANLGMLDTERDEYATNLADTAINGLAAAKASDSALADARRMLALALNLSPRNKRALVACFQLGKGMLPEAAEAGYSPQAFARLLHARAALLEKEPGAENRLLSRMFVELAAALDPKNEDAVYACEVRRVDHGDLDWNVLTEPMEQRP